MDWALSFGSQDTLRHYRSQELMFRPRTGSRGHLTRWLQSVTGHHMKFEIEGSDPAAMTRLNSWQVPQAAQGTTLGCRSPDTLTGLVGHQACCCWIWQPLIWHG